jgi:hypothetical protein
MDTTHLQALITRLGNEQGYLAKAKSSGEVALRTVWIAQVRAEISREEQLLGFSPATADMLTDDELLAELRA